MWGPCPLSGETDIDYKKGAEGLARRGKAEAPVRKTSACHLVREQEDRGHWTWRPRVQAVASGDRVARSVLFRGLGPGWIRWA